jgi:hypothetical protein
MPVRRRIGLAPKLIEVNPIVLVWGDGTWSFFQDTPRYPSPAAAEAAWPRLRREVWALTNRTRVPGAAKAYDALTDRGFEWLWSHWNHLDFSSHDALDAINTDRDGIEAFKACEPRAARGIADFLDIRMERLARLETLAREVANLSYIERLRHGLPRVLLVGSQTYGDAVRGQVEPVTKREVHR